MTNDRKKTEDKKFVLLGMGNTAALPALGVWGSSVDGYRLGLVSLRLV